VTRPQDDLAGLATPRATDTGTGPETGPGVLLRLRDVSKRYGRTQALDGADLDVRRAETLGLVGHNGAGKSTLMRVLVGLTTPERGEVELDGRRVERWSPEAARAAGVRIVYQEGSLCPDLRVFENVLVSHPGIGGRRWRARTRRLVREQLDEVFPGHGISPWARIETLSLARRQMLEIAIATMPHGGMRIVVLDEPTSALDRDTAARLFDYLRRRCEDGVSFVLISHRMGEILGQTDRITVLRDGRAVATRPSGEVGEDDLVSLMGGATGTATSTAPRQGASGEPVLTADDLRAKRLRGVSLSVGRGEVVGLSGLEGQGQQDLLFELWRRRSRPLKRGLRVGGRMAFVTGDRQAGGVFALWPLAPNITVGSLREVSRWGAIGLGAERRLADRWIERLAVRGRARTPIIDLSGGNQQKVLIARALAAGAELILLDDPFRGVDISTRQETYRLVREEADRGRSFLWFSTENQELEHCDRVLVFREGEIVGELEGDEISEERIIATSFARRPGGDEGAEAA
jgi:ribose transport system ATP-binding protein